MVLVEVIPRSKGLKALSTGELEVDSTVQHLLNLISKSQNISKDRIRLTMKDVSGKQVPLDTSKTFDGNGISKTAESITLYSKDLGPQIAWRTVFIIEYFGPLLVHPLFYLFSSVYGQESFTHTHTQFVAYALVLLHFLKREYETVFVHKFSNATMPVFNILKNSSHYWILSGFNLSFFIYGPPTDGSSSLRKFLFHVNDFPDYVNYALAGLWLFAELSNFATHLNLAGLRSSSNTKNYVIPYGYGFDWVSCPNYFFESLSWLLYALLVGNWSSWVFFAVATGQMWVWAVKKHKRYLKTFGDDYKKLKRKVYVPFLA